jgi:GTP-binding protein
MRSIDRADVALLLIDATEGVTAQDAHVAGYVLDRNKSVVVIVNKWDAVEKDTHTMVEFTKQIRNDLKFLDYVPVLFISAMTRQRLNRVLPEALAVAEARRHRLTTGQVNHIIHEAYDRNAPPTRQGRAVRLYYGTQIETEPPTFIIFVNDAKLIHFSYERYLENQIRAFFPFPGTPIRVIFRSRERK